MANVTYLIGAGALKRLAELQIEIKMLPYQP